MRTIFPFINLNLNLFPIAICCEGDEEIRVSELIGHGDGIFEVLPHVAWRSWHRSGQVGEASDLPLVTESSLHSLKELCPDILKLVFQYRINIKLGSSKSLRVMRPTSIETLLHDHSVHVDDPELSKLSCSTEPIEESSTLLRHVESVVP